MQESSGGDKGCEWDLILEEFRSLREEELGKMDKQYKILALGVSGTGTLLGLAFQYSLYPLFLVLPLIILSFMSLYHWERLSILNAAEYIRGLEGHFIKDYPESGWERWLKKHPKKCAVYAFTELVSTFCVFCIYLLCIYGILASDFGTGSFIFIGSLRFRYLASAFYFLLGALIFLIFNYKNLKECLGLNPVE
ncbi:hypothetical protein ACSAZK_10870 [Methanosarcina sp. Mfa9]|uniref:hypothetical protein n=1 Tax=Methanosarcina sp. Mfa9 TaxID=3439063 RepID=UPI003F831DF5